MSNRLEGKIAVVTGGSRGIGAAIAEAFAREGAKVVISSRKQPGLDAMAAAINEQYPESVFPRACHVGKADMVKALIDWTCAEIGIPNVLVNNAATNPHFGPMLTISDAAWDKTFEVNLKGVFEPTRHVAQRLIGAKRGGSIINISSVAGLRAAPLQGVYGMTKAAINSMTQTLAMELGPAGIRVNAVAPGLVDTRLAAAITHGDVSKYFTERTAQKRYAQPDEISGLVVFLASDEASYVTGQTYAVDGGFTVS